MTAIKQLFEKIFRPLPRVTAEEKAVKPKKGKKRGR